MFHDKYWITPQALVVLFKTPAPLVYFINANKTEASPMLSGIVPVYWQWVGSTNVPEHYRSAVLGDLHWSFCLKELDIGLAKEVKKRNFLRFHWLDPK